MFCQSGTRFRSIVGAAILLAIGCSTAAARPASPWPGPVHDSATDEGLPGAGPIRRYDWFQSLWRERRSAWAQQRRAGPGRRRLSRRLDHAGLGRRARRGLPRASRSPTGESAATPRAACCCGCRRTCSRSSPAAVVLLIGTNDLEEGATPEVIAGNLKLILAGLKRHNPRMPDRAVPGLPQLGHDEAPGGPDQGDQRALPGRREERPAGHVPRDVAAVCRSERRCHRGRVPRSAAPERSRLREMGGGAASDLRDPRAFRDDRGSVHARRGIREPVQRPRPDRLGLSAHLRGGQGERRALAGLGSQRRGLADRHRAGRLRRPAR